HPRVRRLPDRGGARSRRGGDVPSLRSRDDPLPDRRAGRDDDDRSRRTPGKLRTERAFLMHTIELTEEELRLIHQALHSYLDDFGHEEADALRTIKALIAKLPADYRGRPVRALEPCRLQD